MDKILFFAKRWETHDKSTQSTSDLMYSMQISQVKQNICTPLYALLMILNKLLKGIYMMEMFKYKLDRVWFSIEDDVYKHKTVISIAVFHRLGIMPINILCIL